jgi:hypothetical protein
MTFRPTFKHTTVVVRSCTEQWLFANGNLQWLTGNYDQKPGILFID